MAFVFRSPPSCQVKTGACKHLKINTTIYQVRPRGPRLHFIFLLCIRFSLKYTLENKASFEAEHSSGEHCSVAQCEADPHTVLGWVMEGNIARIHCQEEPRMAWNLCGRENGKA